MATKTTGKRQELQKRDGTRFRCRAVVERFGTKAAFRGPPVPTILLRDVVDADTGTLLTHHLWFTPGKWSVGLAGGTSLSLKPMRLMTSKATKAVARSIMRRSAETGSCNARRR